MSRKMPGANAGEADESLHIQVRNQVVVHQLWGSLVHMVERLILKDGNDLRDALSPAR